MQTMIIAHSNYNLAPCGVVDRRTVLRSQLTQRRHSLAQETITATAVTVTSPPTAPPAITLNSGRVPPASASPLSRAFLPLAQQQQLLARQQPSHFPFGYNAQRRFSSSASLANPGPGDGGAGALSSVPISQVAIDSKIEQAMDLVKTHLMFAVREEVELLRSKIVELEGAVIHLEAENSILREHVPQTVLQGLQPIRDGAGGLSAVGGTESGHGHGGADAALLGSAMASLGQPNMAHPQIAQ